MISCFYFFENLKFEEKNWKKKMKKIQLSGSIYEQKHQR